MRTARQIGIAACALALSAGAIAACGEHSDYAEAYPGELSTAVDGGFAGDGAPSVTPMLVQVDPNGTITQTPGQGVGVFAQYQPGGHWYVFWTCDTDLSDESCPFTIEVTAENGDITAAVPQGFGANDDLVGGGQDGGGGSSAITARTTTTTTVQGVEFDTTPGAKIQLSAALDGEYSGSFLFFVQDNQVNGGYTGTVTDPLDLVPTSP